MLSDKARTAAEKIKALSESDLKSLSETIKHEVEHAAHVVQERAKEAQFRARELAEDAGEHVQQFSRDARRVVEEKPATTALVALGVGFVVGLLVAGSARR